MYNYNFPLGYWPQPKFKNTTKNKQINLLNLFDEGVALEKLKKIELRKDAMMLLRVKQKYDIISEHYSKYKKTNKKIPYIKLDNGENLLTQNPENMFQFREIYEIFLEELQSCNIAFFGLLPNLKKLTIRFSNITLLNEDEYLEENRYKNLTELNLNCNNLDSSCLEIIKHMTNLKKLNLMGNFITADIPDLSSLLYLEELDLSYNRIESYFINLNMLREFNEKNNMNNMNNMNMNNNNFNLFNENNNLNNNINNNLNEMNINNNNENENEKLSNETNQKRFNETQKTFQQLQTYLKTNMQDFFHKLSLLNYLTKLNVSYNKINYFDIDTNFIINNNGFRNLITLDISNNLIEDEIAILMIVNLPKIKNVDVTNNPLTFNQKAYEDIEYEIFKFKNILLINNKEFKKLKSRYNVNDIMNHPPMPYLVKKFKLEQKNKNELIVKPKEEILELKEENKEEKKEGEEKELELPPICMPSINPILLTKLDYVGKRKNKK